VDVVAVVDQVIALLRQRGRVVYRTLQRQLPDATGRWHMKSLISAARPSDGSPHRHQRGRLALTVTGSGVAHATWHELVTREERDTARCRLIAYA
jgi:hypothetical protein